MNIGHLNLGKVDGKYEFLAPRTAADEDAFDAFLIPENVRPEQFGNFDRYFVTGFRGTGKTSLLRWFSEQRKKEGAIIEFVLFKSSITEERRASLSSEVGYTFVQLETEKMEFSQDFKTAWTWFTLHKVVEALRRHPSASETNPVVKLARLFGLEKAAFQKIMGVLPKLTKLNVTVSADLEFFSAELGAELERNGATATVSLDALNRRAMQLLNEVDIKEEIYVFFDELEVFYDEPSKFVRDQRMVRDLIFVISALNEELREKSKPIHVIGAVRSEVLDGFGALGQEIERPVHDKGVELSWHGAKRGIGHPLFAMIANKIRASDQSCRHLENHQVIEKYFPKKNTRR